MEKKKKDCNLRDIVTRDMVFLTYAKASNLNKSSCNTHKANFDRTD